MSEHVDVTVVLSTFNRAEMLPDAIKSLLSQAEPYPHYEVLVVDNNSTDHTRSVVQKLLERVAVPLHYVFEPRQGLSHARNAGIDAARGNIVAFTDDDVRVTPHWVRVIHEAFAKHRDVECVGGRTLPQWPTSPPAWLTRQHWVGPLALQDYGDEPQIMDARHPLCLAGANFAFRKRIFERIGRFSPEFPRAQDTELMLRLYRAGYRALYVPDMLIHAAIEPDRLTKTYHRRWHSTVGRYNARMRFHELGDPVLGLRPEIPHLRRLFGVPLFAFRQCAGEVWKWAINSVSRRPAEAFLHETRVRALVSYMREARVLEHRDRAPLATPRSEP